VNAGALVDSLDRFGIWLPQLVTDCSATDAVWRPEDGGWSILEIVCHLCDEEEYDFGARLKAVLDNPAAAWSPIDPPAWAVERRYNERDLSREARRFGELRRVSVAWLRGLHNPSWTREYQHQKAGHLRAGDLLAAWAAHDHLHLRQLARRFYQMAQRDAAPFSPGYAGSWTP
jgi:hypothetical protein